MNRVVAVAVLMALFVGVESNAADRIDGYVYTEIIAPDPQAGMKSKHNFFIDFKAKNVTHNHRTGTTNVGVGNVGSIRDDFTVKDEVFSDAGVTFRVVGQTASGVIVMPDIDYSFEISVSPTGEAKVRGCHDAYPAYRVVVNGKTLYNFKHEPVNLLKLFGDCDIKVDWRAD